MTLFVIIIISVNFQLQQLSAKFIPLTISNSCCSIPISSLVIINGELLEEVNCFKSCGRKWQPIEDVKGMWYTE